MILVINGVVLTVACTAFFIYEYYNSRKNTLNKVAAIGQIIATNSTAALAFDNKEDATEILMALKAEPHVEMAVLFNEEGKIVFASIAGIAPSRCLPLPLCLQDICSRGPFLNWQLPLC